MFRSTYDHPQVYKSYYLHILIVHRCFPLKHNGIPFCFYIVCICLLYPTSVKIAICEASNTMFKMFKSFSRFLLWYRRYVFTWRYSLFPWGWACCLTFPFTFSLLVMSSNNLKNHWCTYINYFDKLIYMHALIRN